MNITIIGSGYVGLVSGACLADVGNSVVCLDIDRAKIARLNAGDIPIYEPGLADLIRRNRDAGRLNFTDDAAVATRHGVLQMIAVGTPPGEDGSADLRHVLAAARSVARHMDGYRVFVNKSTVPVGTASRVKTAIQDELRLRGADLPFHVTSNPEFLKEGAAIDDFMRPDRIVVGAEDDEAIALLRQLYAPFERNHAKLLVTDLRSAELIKYAANAMLATRISFMNQLAVLAEAVGADIDAVRRGIGSDPRIGNHFLYAGCGYGGSCFPKDVKALIHTGREHGEQLDVLIAVDAANERQKRLLAQRVVGRFGPDLTGRVFAVWGLAFKPGTDDMREAPSLTLITELLERGATVQAYDPVATAEARRVLGEPDRLRYCPRAMAALEGADALVLVTEWKEFRSPDFASMKAVMREAVICDGRNIYDPAVVRGAGFDYTGIGRP